MNNLCTLNMDAFSDGQVSSKLWLCEEAERAFQKSSNIKSLWVYGSWYGTLPFLLLTRDRLQFDEIHLFDIDLEALQISRKVMTRWVVNEQPRIYFHHRDCNQPFPDKALPSLVINTSTEHFDKNDWWSHLPTGTKFVLQSTDMEHVEHINKSVSVQDFKNRLHIKDGLLFEGVRNFSYINNFSFNRFMLIGEK